MNPFELYQGKTALLEEFPFIASFTYQKIQQITLHSMPVARQEGLRLFGIQEGRFDWKIDDKSYLLYPNDALVVCPWQAMGSTKGHTEIGAFVQLQLLPSQLEGNGHFSLGEWSQLPTSDQRIIGKILGQNNRPVLPRFKRLFPLFETLAQELAEQELGYRTRVRQLVDEILLTVVRAMSKQEHDPRDFPQTFLKLEQSLRNNLEHPWTVEEMAGLVGLGTTAFSEKVKRFSGFSPLNYLINIRISEAMRLLKSTEDSLTDIAFQTGFYSSQHFSSTFKKLTGYTPRDFRKNNP